MNILVISQHYYPENFRINDITQELVKLGHKVTVLCGYPNYPEGDIYKGYKGKNAKKHKKENIKGVNVIRSFEISRGKNAFKLFLNYYSVSLSMKRKAKRLKEKFDLVLVNQLSPVMQSWAGLSYAKKHKVPCLIYCYDLWPESLMAGGIKEGSIIFNHYFKVSNKIYKKADRIMCTSEEFISYFVDKHGIDMTKLSYLPQYSEDLFNEVVIKQDFEGYNYVFAGNIGKVQSVETIIKAANIIKDEKDIKIHIVGDGSNLEKCKNLVSEHQLDNVIFHGKHKMEDMPKFYNMASAMLLTLSDNKTISRTLPGKVQTYMAAGKPIIASINGESATVIQRAKCGIYCEAEDYKKLAKLMVEFKSIDYKELSINSRKYYDNNFRKERFMDNLLSIMEEEINAKI